MPRARRRFLPAVLATALVTTMTSVLAATAAPSQADPAPTVGLSSHSVMETARGPARTVALPDGGWLSVYAFGSVVRHDATGASVWNRTSSSFYSDWHVTWQGGSAFPVAPELAWGNEPAVPLNLAGPKEALVNDTAPDVVGDLTGDGTPDVAVADVVGDNFTGKSQCGTCYDPFDVPGSNVHVGTFVTVLDGRTGKTVYSELEPGFVSELAISGKRLLIGDEDGDPQGNQTDTGTWGGTTTVQALHLVKDGDSYAAHQDWRWSTKAQWARVYGLVDTGNGTTAVAWSDTPPGLGVPGPPDGHVVLLNTKNGRAQWDQRTPDYPTLIASDPGRNELVTVQEADPAERTGYTVRALSATTGAVVASSSRSGSLPTALSVTGTGTDDAWVITSIDATVIRTALVYQANAGRVSLVAPATARERWSTTVPDGAGEEAVSQPGSVVVAGSTVVVASTQEVNTQPTVTTPLSDTDGVAGLDKATGRLRWHVSGDVGTPTSLSLATPSSVRAITDNLAVRTYRAATGALGKPAADIGDVLSTASVSTGTGSSVLTGDQSGAVDSYDGAGFGSSSSPKPQWQTVLEGPVRALAPAKIGNRQVVVAAVTEGVDVLDATTGRVLSRVPTPGTFVWTVTIGTAGSRPAFFVPSGSTLAAYALDGGTKLWSYQAPAGATFSNATELSGAVLAEYSSAETSTPAKKMAALGLNSATGKRLWISQQPQATTRHGLLWNGVASGTDIPGANGRGAAFTWQNTDGDGRVDVRNALTGALDYSDTSSAVASHAEYLLTRGDGLVSVGWNGSTQITPAGAHEMDQADGYAGDTVDTGASGPVLLVASPGVAAFDESFTGDGDQSEITEDDTYYAGRLSNVTADGGTEVLATPDDPVTEHALAAATGQNAKPFQEFQQHGLLVETVTTTSSGAAHHAKASPIGATHGTVSAGPAAEPVRVGSVTPQHKVIGKARTRAAGPMDAGSAVPYQPSTIRKYLGLKGTGAGETIAIVDAYHDPSLVADVGVFDKQFALPDVCATSSSTGCFHLNVSGSVTATDSGWALETSLDVEWAHAIAPMATIDLVQSNSAALAPMFAAVDQATAKKPAAVSMSWGVGLEFTDETFFDKHCAVSTTVCTVSTGDRGFPGSYPAYSPSVVAVGGTTLNLNTDGTVAGEIGWNESGGGTSWVEKPSAPQRTTESATSREIPDVSFDADPATGVAVYDSQDTGGESGWWQVGGTSVGAPVWAALLADADQLRAQQGKAPLTAKQAQAQKAIYSLPAGSLADIASGPSNGYCPTGCVPTPGFDTVTGLGSPRTGIDAKLAGAKR